MAKIQKQEHNNHRTGRQTTTRSVLIIYFAPFEYIQFEIDTRKPIRTNMSHMRAHRPQFQFPDVQPAIRHGQVG